MSYFEVSEFDGGPTGSGETFLRIRGFAASCGVIYEVNYYAAPCGSSAATAKHSEGPESTWRLWMDLRQRYHCGKVCLKATPAASGAHKSWYLPALTPTAATTEEQTFRIRSPATSRQPEQKGRKLLPGLMSTYSNCTSFQLCICSHHSISDLPLL